MVRVFLSSFTLRDVVKKKISKKREEPSGDKIIGYTAELKRHPGGRPSIYSSQLAQEFCRRYGCSRLTIRQVCAAEDMPSHDTVWRWAYDIPEFSDLLTRARLAKMAVYADECQEIADDGSNDWMTIQRGEEPEIVLNHEHVKRSQLRIQTRQWQMERLSPAFSQKQEQKVAHSVEGMPTEQILEQLAALGVKVTT